MTHTDRETMQKAIGIIEGVLYYINDDATESALAMASNLLNSVLGSEQEVRK